MQPAQYKGSTTTYELVKEQIAERFGDDAAEEYSPEDNCFTLPTWNAKGYKIKKGQKALRSFTLVESEDKNGDKRKFRKPVFLFFENQVEKINS